MEENLEESIVRMVSTFHDLETAEWAVRQLLDRHHTKIVLYSKLREWFNGVKNRQFEASLDRSIGWGIYHDAQDDIVQMSTVRVVIQFVEYNHMPYYILTSFPSCEVGAMKYSALTDFLYDAGSGVGAFLSDEGKEGFTPMRLDEIVSAYLDERNFLASYFLGKDIKRYIGSYMTPEGLDYADPPFDQDTSFPEEYFEGDLYSFLIDVLELLDQEKSRRWRRFFRLS
ncbi:RNase A-like domain-containing protein [Pseudomonas viridiflava]|uniref:RNase A-like domain-containing protein n=1 Tax=Pseudomonas viridiflava TaxID=33069 RepID=UPI002A6A832E|nr:RNase A-like domain-containing protein [Pseudomonas viridiflava]MDY0916774.1 RNase A-like domain-containing protein [Pseudomonas viridiflava]